MQKSLKNWMLGQRLDVKGPHLDPDLVPGTLPRPPDWLPAFGQDSAAASHLRNQGVSRGDLFLFFGWFRHTEEVEGQKNAFTATSTASTPYSVIWKSAILLVPMKILSCRIG